MNLPRLHVVTNDVILGRSTFHQQAGALLDAFGPAVALHLRGRGLSGRVLHDHAVELAAAALRTSSLLLVNERVDLALAARTGAHLNAGSLPLVEARRLLHHAPLGYSAHTADEALLAQVEGADFVFLGTIFASASHPDRPPAGVELLRRAVPRLEVPVIAIGGITPGRVAEVRAAGAWGIAAITGIWDAPDPVAAAREYLAALEQ